MAAILSPRTSEYLSHSLVVWCSTILHFHTIPYSLSHSLFFKEYWGLGPQFGLVSCASTSLCLHAAQWDKGSCHILTILHSHFTEQRSHFGAIAEAMQCEAAGQLWKSTAFSAGLSRGMIPMQRGQQWTRRCSPISTQFYKSDDAPVGQQPLANCFQNKHLSTKACSELSECITQSMPSNHSVFSFFVGTLCLG